MAGVLVSIEFPPLLTGFAVAGDPFEAACAAAETAEPGSVFYSPDEGRFQVAVLLAPESPLEEAISVIFAAKLALNDAVGALGPPEVALHFEWPVGFRVNGARCGEARARAATNDPKDEPDWLVVGLDVPVMGAMEVKEGEVPEHTSLHAEGCGEITTSLLTETWARYFMSWLHIYMTDGFPELHEEWRSRGYRLGETIETPLAGTFVGLDEWGGMILNDGEATRILPLTQILEPT